MDGSPRKRADLIVLSLLALGFFLALKIRQYQAFGVHGELANFEYMLWSTLKGRFLHMYTPGVPLFSQHVSPIMLILVPIYALFSSPITLLVIQGSAAALAVIPLYLIVHHLLGSRWCAIALCLSYFFSRVINYGLMYDFHMEVFYPLLFFWVFWAALKEKWTVFYVFLVLALSVKEDAAVAAAGLGLFLVAAGGRKHGAVTLAISLLWLVISVGVIIPAFRRGLADTGYLFSSYWSGYGDTTGEILKNMLNPVKHIQVLFTPEKLGKTFNLFSVFCFLPLFWWRVLLLLVIPNWFILYSSENPMLYGPSIYYGFLISAFLFFGTALVMNRIGAKWSARGARWMQVLAALVLVVHLGNSRIFKQLTPGAWKINPRFATAQKLIDDVPPDAPVSAQVDLLSHLPIRLERNLLPYRLDEAH